MAIRLPDYLSTHTPIRPISHYAMPCHAMTCPLGRNLVNFLVKEATRYVHRYLGVSGRETCPTKRKAAERLNATLESDF